jgi:hypothetical protein
MKKLTNTLTIFLCFVFSIYSQKVDVKPFSIDKSDLIGDLKNLKASNPKLLTEDFVKAANTLLDKKGINFVVGFDSATCQKIEQVKKSQKDPSLPLNLRTTLKSSIGEAASLALPEAKFQKTECFSCFVNLPFVEVTQNEFVTIVQGINLKFYLPTNFFLNEVSLVDEKDFSVVKRKWKIPFNGVPLSVSDDGNILYFGFEEPELSDLALLAFGEGSFQFYSKKDIDDTKKGTIVKDVSPNAIVPNFSYIKFESPEMKQVLKFPTKCSN